MTELKTIPQQLDILARSAEAVQRAKAYEDSIGRHIGELKDRLAAAVQPDTPAADRSALRAELAGVEKRYQMAISARHDLESEHARHVADHAAMVGVDGVARLALAGRVDERNAAVLDLESAKSTQRAAQAFADDIQQQLQAAEAREQAQDRNAVDRLQATFQAGSTPQPAGKADRRKSIGLAEDLRTARLTVEKFGQDVADREAVLTAAEQRVAAAVDDVLFAEAEAIARDLEATEARALMLRQRLVAYSERVPCGHIAPVAEEQPATQHSGGWMVRVPLPYVAQPKAKQSPLMSKLLGGNVVRPRSFDTVPAPGNWQPEALAWAAYVDALKTDPAADAIFAIAAQVAPQPMPIGLAPASSAPATAARNLSIRAAATAA